MRAKVLVIDSFKKYQRRFNLFIEYKTCLCEIILPDDSRGYFYFEFGVLFDAFHGALRGEAAAIRLLLTDNATIKFRKAPKIKIPRQIKTGLGALIEEAGRLKSLKFEIDNWKSEIGSR